MKTGYYASIAYNAVLSSPNFVTSRTCPHTPNGVHSWIHNRVLFLLREGWNDVDIIQQLRIETSQCGRDAKKDIHESIRTGRLYLSLAASGELTQVKSERNPTWPDKSSLDIAKVCKTRRGLLSRI
jgi:hypothetical protein